MTGYLGAADQATTSPDAVARHHDTGRVCVCQADHRPAPLELERHHVWPLGMGGPDIDANVAWICPTTHTNTHEILRMFLKSHRVLSWREVLDTYEQTVNRYAYDLARVGYVRWVASRVDAAQVPK